VTLEIITNDEIFTFQAATEEAVLARAFPPGPPEPIAEPEPAPAENAFD